MRLVLVTGAAGRVGQQLLPGLPDRFDLRLMEAPWQELRDPNVEGFAALLAVSRARGVRRVIFANSVHAMGAYDDAAPITCSGLGQAPA